MASPFILLHPAFITHGSREGSRVLKKTKQKRKAVHDCALKVVRSLKPVEPTYASKAEAIPDRSPKRLSPLTPAMKSKIHHAFAILRSHPKAKGSGISIEAQDALLALSRRISLPSKTALIRRIGAIETIRPLIVIGGEKPACYVLLNGKDDPIIGKGSFNVVRGAVGLHDGELSVVRECDIGKMTLTHEMTSFQALELLHSEARIGAMLSDLPGIVPLYTTIETERAFFSIHPYFRGGDLDSRLSLLPALPILKRVHIMRSLLNTLVSIHDRHIIHRDIKPKNILFDSGSDFGWGLPFIGDFGFATRDDDRGPLGINYVCGDEEYAPPECMKSQVEPPATEKQDAWAMGSTLYTLITGNFLPWQNSERVEAIKDLEMLPTDWKPLFPETGPMRQNPLLSTHLEAILSGLLNPDPERRLDAREALRLCDTMITEINKEASPKTLTT